MMLVNGSAHASTVARSEQLSIGTMSGPCVAIDIGGTKIDIAIVSVEGTILDREMLPTDQDADDSLLFSAVMETAGRLIRRAPHAPTVCGVGCGGPMAREGVTVSPLNIPAWRSFPLRARLREALDLPVAVDNDAKALALAEGWLGAARNVDSYVAMVVSTGIGGGIVLNGKLLNGAEGNAGHLGHLVVEPNGRRCVCGVRGCLEAEASGTAIRAITGRPAAQATPHDVERCGEMVGRAVASVVTLLDLDLCLVAGSVALGFGIPFFDAANRSMRGRLGLDYTRSAVIAPAGLGADAPILGAARVGFLSMASTVG